ncbi:hypothetical protein ABT336_01580 [Micromonospora sp. NPDC000207]|uniref:hypothetical protein n=1 Tax=Micromonospora sp. NPDC000207 TaxID=3154246 RepID=UPI003325548D
MSTLSTRMVDLIVHGLRTVGRAMLPVGGVSMLPTLRTGDRVELFPVPPGGVVPGDVVAFRYRDELVLHRVHARHDGWLTTAGDSRSLFDPPIPVTDVVGVARGVPPRPDPQPWRPADPGTGAPVTVWIVTDDRRAGPPSGLPPGWRVQVRPAYGIGVTADVLAELRAELADRPCLGLTEHAVHGVDEVVTGPLPAGTQIVVGCSFGRLDGDLPGRLLPPELADVHLRTGPARVRVDPSTALATLTRATERVAG